MKRKGFKDSESFRTACRMPTGIHHEQNLNCDWSKSALAQWLVRQPEILKYITLKCIGSGAVVLDPETQTWKGRDS